MSSPTAKHGGPRKLSFFGHFGSTNPGNESTLVTMLSQARSLWPQAELRCVCTFPDAVAARDGIDAIPITTREARFWDPDVPVVRRVPMALVGLAAELAQYARAFRELEGTDALIVPGTGPLTDAYSLSSWGLYSQFKWVLMAKARRCRVLYVSVGAGPIRGARGRALARVTLSLADYRSYRDRASRDCVAAIGVGAEHDPIYPDLVFSLPPELLPTDQARSDDARPVVGLGLMEYAPKLSADHPRPETYATYLDSLAEFAAWLIEHGYDIRLLLGDADTVVVDLFRSALRAQSAGWDDERIVEHPITSVTDILTELAATDLVVATRFHNVLLAMLLGKPTIAISFHHKCSSLMDQMGLSEYCHDIHRMDAGRLIKQFHELEHNQMVVTRTIAAGLDAARAELAGQYELLGQAATRGPARRMPVRHLRRRFQRANLDLGERIWRHLPPGVRALRPVRAYGAWSHGLVRRRADREMYLGTHFLRNRPALELMRRLVVGSDAGARIEIAVLGCSIGVEVYSIVWTLRRSRPDLDLAIRAIDISADVIDVARRGVYSPASSAMVGAAIFEPLGEAERQEMFDWEGDAGTVKPWLRDGVTWHVGDAGNPSLIEAVGPRDLVIANNFLCHMRPQDADWCLRNLAGLVRPGGHLFVAGVDLDVRTRVARDLGWQPIAELRSEIHDGDRLVRSDWPWRWWGLEPLDRRRVDWEMRYAVAFRIGRRNRAEIIGGAAPSTHAPRPAALAQARTPPR